MPEEITCLKCSTAWDDVHFQGAAQHRCVPPHVRFTRAEIPGISCASSDRLLHGCNQAELGFITPMGCRLHVNDTCIWQGADGVTNEGFPPFVTSIQPVLVLKQVQAGCPPLSYALPIRASPQASSQDQSAQPAAFVSGEARAD